MKKAQEWLYLFVFWLVGWIVGDNSKTNVPSKQSC
jgi:hypothetical protein